MRKEGCGREGRGRNCEGIEERSPINCSKFSTVGISCFVFAEIFAKIC